MTVEAGVEDERLDPPVRDRVEDPSPFPKPSAADAEPRELSFCGGLKRLTPSRLSGRKLPEPAKQPASVAMDHQHTILV